MSDGKESDETEPTTIPIHVEESPPSSSSKSDSKNPPIPKGTPRWLKNVLAWANVSKGPIAAAAALLTALGALFKPPDHSVTKTAYDTLSVGFKQLADEQKKDHDDIVAMRGYLDGMNHNLQLHTNINIPSPSPAPSAAEVPQAQKPSLGGAHKHPHAAPVEPAGVSVVMAPAPAMAMEPPPVQDQAPPPVHLEPKQVALPGFEDILKR